MEDAHPMSAFGIPRKPVVAMVLLSTAVSLPVHSWAQERPWLLRARAVHVDPANRDTTGLGLALSSKTIAEVDVTYFLTANIAAELILTYPQKHDLLADGQRIGQLKELPPTLTLQYHATSLGPFKPYVGAGINYTRLSQVRLPAGIQVKKDSLGAALQLGIDYALTKNLYLNADVKRVWLKTDVAAGGAAIGTLKVNPVLFGVGLGWRF